MDAQVDEPTIGTGCVRTCFSTTSRTLLLVRPLTETLLLSRSYACTCYDGVTALNAHDDSMTKKTRPTLSHGSKHHSAVWMRTRSGLGLDVTTQDAIQVRVRDRITSSRPCPTMTSPLLPHIWYCPVSSITLSWCLHVEIGFLHVPHLLLPTSTIVQPRPPPPYPPLLVLLVLLVRGPCLHSVSPHFRIVLSAPIYSHLSVTALNCQCPLCIILSLTPWRLALGGVNPQSCLYLSLTLALTCGGT